MRGFYAAANRGMRVEKNLHDAGWLALGEILRR
jgi:hypothetical protein